MSITNDTTVKASRTITPIEGTDGRFEWYQYNEDLRIIHDTHHDAFQIRSICRSIGLTANQTTNSTRWFREGHRGWHILTCLSTHIKIDVGQLYYKVDDEGTVKGTSGMYLTRLAINLFVADYSPEYLYKIMVLLDDHFELQRKVEENRALSDKNKSLEQKVDQLLVDNQELLRINKDQSAKLDDMSYRLKKTYATVQSIADLPEKLNNNVSSGNTIENVYIYALPDECDDESMVIHLSARTDQSLKTLRSKLPTDHTVIDHFRIANAKDCIREIIGEAESYGIVSSVRPTYSISIATDDLDTFKSAIEVILRKLNRSPKIVRRTVETTEKLNPLEYVSKEWSISETIIKDILKTHNISIETLNGIVKGDILYRTRGKDYTIKFYDQTPYLIYGRQLDESVKWFFIRPGTIKNVNKDSNKNIDKNPTNGTE